MFKRYYLLYSIEQGPVFFEVDLQEGGLKSYYCFLKYSYFDFLRKWFLQLHQKLYTLLEEQKEF
jgi:hypothetical protein